jgi:hypothetical protein
MSSKPAAQCRSAIKEFEFCSLWNTFKVKAFRCKSGGFLNFPIFCSIFIIGQTPIDSVVSIKFYGEGRNLKTPYATDINIFKK